MTSNFYLILLITLESIVLFYLIYPFLLYVFTTSNIKKNKQNVSSSNADYGIIVTAYEQTDLLSAVVESLLKLNYNNYLIYVVADNCDISTLSFHDPRVMLLRPEVVLASNAKSHFYAISNFKRPHERLTIIDSDNLVDAEYLNQVNFMFDRGYMAVQGVRRAKNLNSQYACLDEAGDIYYRFIDRKLLFECGSSASLAGSGMAFDTKLYIDCLSDFQIGGAGFDKILQYQLLIRKFKIAFSEGAIVYDEKTSKSEQLVKQRARWINTWFKFFILGIKMNLKSISTFDKNQFLFSLMLLRPPLFLLFLFGGFFGVLNILFFPFLAIGLIIGLALFIFIFFKALNYFNADELVYRSLRNAPKFIYHQIAALLKAKKANKLSVSTKHEYQSHIKDFKP